MKIPKEQSGLTVNGICVQILGSLSTYRNYRDYQTANDCKVTINHLIRKFSEPAKANDIVSKNLTENENINPVREHVIPVLVIMEELLNEDKWKDVSITEENIKKLAGFLTRYVLIAKITPDENAKLNKAGCQKGMPPDWSWDIDPDLYARYRVAGILENMNIPDSNV